MKNLLISTAAIEYLTGLILVSLPSQLISLLFGSTVDSPLVLTVARVAGVALIALGIACWIARQDNHSVAAKGLVAAMIVYNVGVLAVLTYAGVVSGLSGIGLWPVVLVHFVMAVWSVLNLLNRPA